MTRVGRGPRTVFRRLVGGIVMLAMASPFLAVPGYGAGPKEPPDPVGRLKTVEQRLEQSRQEEDALTKRAQDLAAESARLQDAAIGAARTLQASEAEASATESQLATLVRTEQERARDLLARQERERQILMALQRLSALPPEAVIAGQQNPIDAARAGILLGNLVPRIEREAREIAQDLAALRETRIALDAKRDEYKKRLAILTQGRQQLADLVRQKQQLANEARNKAEATQKKVALLTVEAGDLKDLIDRLERQRKAEEERQRKAEEDRVRREAEDEARRRTAKLAERPSEAKPTLKPIEETPLERAALTLPPPPNATRQRRALRVFEPGKTPLLRPVSGEIIRKVGEMDGFIRSEGITWRTRPSAVVVAPFDGKVDYAVMKGYGQILIIVHGGGYYSVLAGIDQIDVSVGQDVLAGEPLGSMSGDVGVGDGTGSRDKGQSLYYEMRKSDKTINPLPWLMARDERVSG